MRTGRDGTRAVGVTEAGHGLLIYRLYSSSLYGYGLNSYGLYSYGRAIGVTVAARLDRLVAQQPRRDTGGWFDLDGT